MTQVYTDTGKCIPITAIEAGPCKVTQVKDKSKDGYTAVQLGFNQARKLNSAEKGHLKETGLFKELREFRVETVEGLNTGDVIDVSQFKAGDKVDVTGVSRGKGYAGVVKRHHFRGGPKTHGQSDRHRSPGAIGATSTPGRVWKNLKMSGHMGSERVTMRNLLVHKADTERNILMIQGAVPGGENGLVIIKKSRVTGKAAKSSK